MDKCYGACPGDYISEIHLGTGLGAAVDGLYLYGKGKRTAHVSTCSNVEYQNSGIIR